ncbi:MAG: hypothetical protein Q7O12_10990 [Deltaproteobacteria bacterium]|nr:hypothetical protein [Deltaproteobacteria bacterium]
MNLKKCWRVILLGGLVVALSAPSAMARTNRPVVGHNPNFRGAAPHGPAYGYRGQRPALNHGNAYGRQHRNQWNQRNQSQNRNQWNQRNAYGSNHQGAWGQRQGARQFHNPNLGRPIGPYTRYSNTTYQPGPRR